mgnify:CR=1 FL=1
MASLPPLTAVRTSAADCVRSRCGPRAALAAGRYSITASTVSIDDIVKLRGAPVWFQLYATTDRDVAYALVKRAENAGSQAVVVTVDRVGGRNQEALFRLRRTDTRTCTNCHSSAEGGGGSGGDRDRRPNYAGIDLSKVRSMQSDNLTWEFIQQLRDKKIGRAHV